MTSPMCDLSVKKTALAPRVLSVPDLPLRLKWPRCLCQGVRTLAQVKSRVTSRGQEYFPYRHAPFVVLEKKQLLLHCDLSHVGHC